jgi:hypothetical protein
MKKWLLIFLLACSIRALAGEWKLDIHNCNVWNPSPIPNETVEWQGKCKEGYAHGLGTVQWFRDGKQSNQLTGIAINGKLESEVKVTYPNGDVYIGELDIDGFKTGRAKYIHNGKEEMRLYYDDKTILKYENQ